MNKLTFHLLVALLLTAVGAWAQDHPGDHPAGDHPGAAQEDLVRLDAATREEFGVVTAVAGPGTLRHLRTLPGEVQPNLDRVAHIVPRYEGVVREVRASVGDQVRAGQTLAVVEGDASLTTFEVRTALAGTIIERHVTLGEAVGREQALFVVADLDTVWIDIAVYLRDLEDVTKGLPVTVSCGRHDGGITANIDYVSPVVDEATRTATARVIMPNGDLHWRPGMFITAEVETASREVAVAVPTTALFTVENRLSVFVETAAGFEPHPVEIGRRTDTLVEITSGLDAGDIYVAEGGFTLKAELEKASFGDGHNH
ncbi:efflux transporter periplasmic adaptor subunit [bacterium]|nr:MAG: efflux transporter periplasmic adaptor subunit [bacterium]